MGKQPRTYRYYLPECGQGPADAIEFKSDWDGSEEFHATWIAEDAAEQNHSENDGWEASWPRVFGILKDDGTPLGMFEVDREAVPQFHAAKVSRGASQCN